MEGGRISFGKIGRRLRGVVSFGDLVKNTKTSENALINTYEDMDSKTKKYNKAYETHLKNIKALDDNIQFNGMETVFRKIIMKDIISSGHIKRNNPLLFRNYVIEGDVLPSTFRREHIMAQIRNIMSKYFGGSDHMFIKNFTVSNITKHDYEINIITIENIKHNKTIPHTDYLIDKEKTRSVIRDILSSTKRHLKRTSLIVEFNSKDSSSKHKYSSKHSSKNSNSHKYKNSNKSSHTQKHSKKDISMNSLLKKISHSKKSASKKIISIKLSEKKPSERRKLTKYMSPYSKKIRNNKVAIEKKEKEQQAQQQAQQQYAKPLAPGQYPPGQGLGVGVGPLSPQIQQQKQNILQGQPNMITPIGQQQPQVDCSQFSGNFENCKNAKCWYTRETNVCSKDRPLRDPNQQPYQPYQPYQKPQPFQFGQQPMLPAANQYEVQKPPEPLF